MGASREAVLSALGRTARVARAGAFLALRVAAVPLALVLAAVLAVWCVGWLTGPAAGDALAKLLGATDPESRADFLRYGGAAAGGAILLAAARDLSRTLPSIIDFVEAPSWQAILQPAGVVFVAVFGLALAVRAVTEAPAPAGRGPVVVSVLPHQAPQARGSLATFYVTFEQDATAASVAAGRGAGIELSAGYRELIRWLAEGLEACAARRGGPVSVQIVGMASSSPFDQKTDEESRPLNRDVANLRARVVAREFERHARGGIRVQAFAWSSYEDMVRARQFSDRRPDGSYDAERGLLNRRAEIHIRDAGGCQLRTPALGG